MQALLAIRDLVLEAQVDGAPRAVVERLSLAVRQNESMALVGESGSGKTLTALAIMGLLPEPAVTVAAGSIELGGVDLLAVTHASQASIITVISLNYGILYVF